MPSNSTHRPSVVSSASALRRAARFTIVVSLIVAAATAGAAATAPTAADEAVGVKKEAQRLHETLIEFDDRPEVTVDQDVRESVQYNLDRGNLDFANDNYAAATEHYDIAIEQAKAELADAYVEAATVSLDTVDRHVTAVTEAGYQTEETAALATQVANEREQLASVDSYAAARAANGDATALRERAADLPTADEVATADWLDGVNESLPLIVGGGLICAVVLAAGGWVAYNALQSNKEDRIRTH